MMKALKKESLERPILSKKLSMESLKAIQAYSTPITRDPSKQKLPKESKDFNGMVDFNSFESEQINKKKPDLINLSLNQFQEKRARAAKKIIQKYSQDLFSKLSLERNEPQPDPPKRIIKLRKMSGTLNTTLQDHILNSYESHSSLEDKNIASRPLLRQENGKLKEVNKVKMQINFPVMKTGRNKYVGISVQKKRESLPPITKHKVRDYHSKAPLLSLRKNPHMLSGHIKGMNSISYHDFESNASLSSQRILVT